MFGRSKKREAKAAAAAPFESGPYVLDEALFVGLAPLLKACQAYAELSGCRFRASSFDGLPGDAGKCISGTVPAEEQEDDETEPGYILLPFPSHSADSASTPEEPLAVGEERAKDTGPMLSAKLSAAPVATSFAQRLRAGDAALLCEMNTAFAMVMEEALRRCIVASFQRLDMWPPMPAPAGVEDGDCSYEDVTAPMPVIAQRAFNHERQYIRDRSEGSLSRPQRQAMTAAFLVDFAHEVGIKLPPMADEQQRRFETFEARTAELEALQLEQQGVRQKTSQEGMEDGATSEQEKEKEKDGWGIATEHRHALALTAFGMATVGPVATVGLFFARRLWQSSLNADTSRGEKSALAEEEGGSDSEESGEDAKQTSEACRGCDSPLAAAFSF